MLYIAELTQVLNITRPYIGPYWSVVYSLILVSSTRKTFLTTKSKQGMEAVMALIKFGLEICHH